MRVEREKRKNVEKGERKEKNNLHLCCSSPGQRGANCPPSLGKKRKNFHLGSLGFIHIIAFAVCFLGPVIFVKFICLIIIKLIVFNLIESGYIVLGLITVYKLIVRFFSLKLIVIRSIKLIVFNIIGFIKLIVKFLLVLVLLSSSGLLSWLSLNLLSNLSDSLN